MSSLATVGCAAPLAAFDRAVMPFVAGGATVVALLLLGPTLSRWFDRRSARAEDMRKSLYLPKAPGLWIYGAPLVALVTFLLFGVVGLWIPGAVVAGVAWVLIDAAPRRAVKARKRRFETQFVEALVGLANSLKAGMSLPQAIEQVSNDTEPPVSQEFALILEEYNHGKTVEQAFADAGRRLDSRNYDLVNHAFRVGKQRGGNLAEVFEKIAASIREIWRLEEHIRTVSTEGRSSARFMMSMPPLFLVLLYVMDPEGIQLLFTDPVGIGILSVVLVMNLLANVWIRKILDVDV